MSPNGSSSSSSHHGNGNGGVVETFNNAATKQAGNSSGLVADVNTSSETQTLVLNTIRTLAADLCQQFKGGHPGTVMGAASIAVALWAPRPDTNAGEATDTLPPVMRYDPHDPTWFARDRFVLSAGHACLLQYLMLHFAGYKQWTLDQVKGYHSPAATGFMSAGHPEIEYPGVEVTTGPLGQGIANAVGLAIAAKNVSATFGDVVLGGGRNTIWCFTGDGCLQEGVGQEAISLAGHLGLDNLVLIYDCNEVTVDGTIGSCFTDDTAAKLRAQNWDVLEVNDGSNDVAAIVRALTQARDARAGKPVMVLIRTIIGIHSRKAGSGSVHGQALGDDEVRYVKEQLGFNPDEKFAIPTKVYEYFRTSVDHGRKAREDWEGKMASWRKENASMAADLEARLRGDYLAESGGKTTLAELLPPKSKLPEAAQPTRKSSGIAVQALAPKYKSFVAGSADLLESTFVNFDGQVEFQNPKTKLGDYSGRQIRYGIREFAMCAIGNGMAAFQKGMFVPVMSTFFMFWIYAAPAARMAALQNLRWIGIGTHDSIGIGEDGPTHQPVGLASLYRSMPNINLLRPADAEEVMGCWLLAMSEQEANTPSIFALSRQPVPLLEGSKRDGVAKGAYSVLETGSDGDIGLVIVATGAEVSRAVELAKSLAPTIKERIRVVSMPSQRHFDAQPASYRRELLHPSSTTLVLALEAWSSYGWARYAHASLSMHSFGYSAPQQTLYEKFGFGVDHMQEKATAWIGRWRKQGEVPGVGEFEELLLEDVEPREKALKAWHHELNGH